MSTTIARGTSHISDHPENDRNRRNDRQGPIRRRGYDDDDACRRSIRGDDDDDEGGYHARAVASCNLYDRTDEEIRKLNKMFEAPYAKIKFRGDCQENWELFKDE